MKDGKSNKNEMWKDVIDYEGLYKVSDLGRVYNLKTKKYIGYKEHQGYIKVDLYKLGKRKTYTAQRRL